MFPLRDDIPSMRFPFVNYTLIGICSAIFLLQASQGPQSSLVERFGMIPARVINPDQPIETFQFVAVETNQGVGYQRVPKPAAPAAVPVLLTLLTCTFLHGGWMHVIGNMWFLYIFGDNVEDRLGHLGYGIFYLASGVAASAAHLAAGPDSTIPTIGASGAVAGVMGAYMFFYPRAKVLSVVPLFYIIQFITIPAPLFLGIWFLLQFFQGAFAITSTQAGGVAWWAHIGGFIVGAAVAWVLQQTHVANPPVKDRYDETDSDKVIVFKRRERF